MITVLYNDESIVVCQKPAGIVSEDGGLPDLLREQLGCDIYPVHRLDKPVGGVMVYAKTKFASAKLSADFQNHAVTKEYLCVVKGIPQEPSATFKDLLYKDTRTNKTFVVNRERKGVKPASLEYRLLETRNSPDGDLSLLKVKLHTGRSHQIRVQFASRKLPLLGDSRYGGKKQGLDVCLWSYRLSFKHPVTHEILELCAYPQDAYPWNIFTYKIMQETEMIN